MNKNKVLCINTEKIQKFSIPTNIALTVGKWYILAGFEIDTIGNFDYYLLYDDNNKACNYLTERFMTLEQVREDKLNQLINV
jgi:hypothetical protein